MEDLEQLAKLDPNNTPAKMSSAKSDAPSTKLQSSDEPSSSSSKKKIYAASTNHSSKADANNNALAVSFPRCSICKTGWYEEEDEGADIAEASNTKKRKQHTTRRPSHHNLLPMPPCCCTTRLALPNNNLPSLDSNNNNDIDPTNALSQIETHTFKNLAICKSCLQKRIDVSNDVQVHSYRQEHIPNGQQNVKFTVEPGCVLCHRKFGSRVLQRLLDSEGGSDKKQGSSSSSSKGKKQKGKNDVNWLDAVEATIQLVGWAKTEQRRERIRRNKRAKIMSSNEEGVDQANNVQIESFLDGFTGGGDDLSSVDCYSYSSDSEYEDDGRRTQNTHRIAVKKGEILEELIQKDPKFRQEIEDQKFIKKMQEEEEQRIKKAEELAKNDHEMAVKMQAKFEEEAGEGAKKRSEPINTRQTRTKRTNPIVEAYNKGSASASAKKTGRKKTSSPRQSVGSIGVAGGASTSPSEPQSLNDAATATTRINGDSSNGYVDAINQIMTMGFRESAAERVLKDTNGNIERAVSILLSEASSTGGM